MSREALEGSDPRRSSPDVEVRPGGGASEGPDRFLQLDRAPFASGRGEQDDDRDVEHQVRDHDRRETASEEREHRNRPREQSGRAEQVEDAEDHDQARQQEWHQKKRTDQGTAGPVVPPEKHPGRVPQRHGERSREGPLHEGILCRAEILRRNQDRPDPVPPAGRAERLDEEDGDREERDQRDEDDHGGE